MSTPEKRPVEAGRIYTKDLRTRGGCLSAFICFAWMVSLFLFGYFVAMRFAGSGYRITVTSATLLVASIVVSAFVGMRQATRYQMRQSHLLRGLLQVKCEEVYGLDLTDAPFVGISPGWGMREYEGDSAWDVGFITFEFGRMRYLGDRTDFELPPNQVIGAGLASDAGSLFPRLDVIWQSAPDADRRVLGVYMRDAGSPREISRQARDLLSRIESWRGAATDALLPVDNPRLPPTCADASGYGPLMIRVSTAESAIALVCSLGLCAAVALSLPASVTTAMPRLLTNGAVIIAGSIAFAVIRPRLARRRQRRFMQRWGIE